MKPNIKANVWKGKEVKNWETELIYDERTTENIIKEKAEKT